MKNNSCLNIIFCLFIVLSQVPFGVNAKESRDSSEVEGNVKTEIVKFTNSSISLSNTNKINAKFSDIDLSTVLRLIAKIGNKSIVIDGDITKKISINFKDTPFNIALKSVLDVGQLEMEENDNVITIQPREKKRVTDGVIVKNINVSDLMNTLNKLFGDRVTLEADINTNMVLLTGSIDVVRTISKIISQLDVPKKQVMIEAAFVEVNLEDNTSLGVNLGAILNKFDSSLSVITDGFAEDPTKLPDPVGLFGSSDVFVGKTNKNINAMIEALQTVTDLKVLTHPKVIGLNDQEAEIIVGKKLGFRVTTTTQTASQETVEFLKVGTQLRFTPHITESNDIVMTIHPEVSDGSISEDGLPNETTTEITTQVRVADGQTFVLGGLIRERIEKIIQRVPLLGRIPYLGVLFRRTVDVKSRSEILVLITPRIVRDGITSLETKNDVVRVREIMTKSSPKTISKTSKKVKSEQGSQNVKGVELDIESADRLWFWNEDSL